ncbi:hypothetical protein WOLCODRAFT_55205, partial [Wolfiporia cocos MD-104 SS10]
PPEFSGDANAIKEWLFKMENYLDKVKIYDNRGKISKALSRLTGTAFRYTKDIKDKYSCGENIGTWVDFIAGIRRTYLKKTDKEVAKLEFDKHFSGEPGKEDLKEKGFFTYCEEFHQLAKLGEYDNSSLLDKLKDTLP